jgi:hypothetical protein
MINEIITYQILPNDPNQSGSLTLWCNNQGYQIHKLMRIIVKLNNLKMTYNDKLRIRPRPELFDQEQFDQYFKVVCRKEFADISYWLPLAVFESCYRYISSQLNSHDCCCLNGIFPENNDLKRFCEQNV